MATSDHPDKIDRFVIQSILGKGAQGIVYHATDPDLNRQVAIKSVLLKKKGQSNTEIEQLLSEARAVSRLNHPNIVTIYDLGLFEQAPYLVLEHIDGQTLQSYINQTRNQQTLLQIMRDIVTGVAAAHSQGIVHCDLKPANILINQDGQAKVADFGLSFLGNIDSTNDESLYGTPQYMAPEYIETRQHQQVSDVFSLGLIFYLMFTGKPAFDGDDVYQLLNAIAHSDVTKPSSLNSEIDERLDAIIIKALAKDPAQRYQNAEIMRVAFADYLSSGEEKLETSGSDATAQFLMRRMRHKKDFPAFSQTISILNHASSSDTEGLASVANVILKDYALTNKVLRLVNSAFYNRSGGKISTISRAVVMLGINPVRSIAAALMLFEHLQNKLQANQLKEDAVQTLFSSLVANDIAGRLGIPGHEEAFLCAMLQKLGKVLVRFYLHDESQAIDNHMMTEQCSENAAASQVLGTTYHRLGMAVAEEWGFPDLIISSMSPLDFEKLPDNPDKDDKLTMISQFSNALGEILSLPVSSQESAKKNLIRQFSKSLKIDAEQVEDLISANQKELTEFAKLIQFDLRKSQFYQQLEKNGETQSDTSENATHQREFDSAQSVEILEENTEVVNQTSQKALTDGIQDITNTLTGDYTINQIMQMILETIYRAFAGSRVVLCLKDAKQGCIRARFGYGENVDNIIADFTIPLAYNPDVFHVAFKNNVDIRIEDTQDEKIRHKIPDWYHRKIGAHSFTIFPILIKHSPIALIYIDSAEQKSIDINDEQLGLLKTLRNQAILAIRNISAS